MNAEYCDDCGRMKDISCVCGLSFREKVKLTNVNFVSWSETRKDK